MLKLHAYLREGQKQTANGGNYNATDKQEGNMLIPKC